MMFGRNTLLAASSFLLAALVAFLAAVLAANRDTLHETTGYIPVALLASGILLAAISGLQLIVHLRQARRLKEVREQLRRVKETGNLAVRLPESESDDLAEATRTMNFLLKQFQSLSRALQESEQRYRKALDDISEQTKAQDALQDSEEKYRLLFENNPQPMYVYDPETFRFMAVNQSAIEHYGWSSDEFLSLTIKDIRPEADVPRLVEDISRAPEGIHRAGLWRHHKKDGALIDVEITVHSIPFGGQRAKLVLVNDVTERRGLEESLRQAQKMEAVGRMAGGVAHDFNNLLMVISGYGELLSGSLAESDPRREYANQILRAASRAGNLTRQLLAFSRRQVSKPRVFDLNRTVNAMEPLLRRLVGEEVKLVVDLDRELGHLRADPAQIEQVIMNLAANARDAMPNGGQLTVRTENVKLSADAARRHGLTRGDYIRLIVTDTGTGIDAESRAHLFEPFFTTKAKGKGTGLGLSVVYGIVEQSNGAIGVDSEKGRGTTFILYFPQTDAPLEETVTLSLSDEKGACQGTVLVVEDEVGVRELVSELLRGKGYQVLEASNGREALERAGGHAGTIDLLLTDVIMPEMNGDDLSHKLLSLRPDLKVIYMSGYAPQTLFRRGGLDPDALFLQKPFEPQVLIQKVGTVLKPSNSN